MNKSEKKLMKADGKYCRTDFKKTESLNPVPFALIGVGAAILLLEGFGGKKKYSAGRKPYQQNLRGNEENQNPSLLKSAGEKISETAGDVYQSAGYAARQVMEGASDAAFSAYRTVDETKNAAYKKAEEYSTQAKETYDEYIEDNPLAVGAVAFAVGAALGLVIPLTRYENEVMGEARQNLFEKAKDSISDFASEVRREAGEIASAASYEN